MFLLRPPGWPACGVEPRPHRFNYGASRRATSVRSLRAYHNSSSLLSAKPRNSTLTSARIFSRGAEGKVLARSSMISPKVASPVQRLMISTAIWSALKTRSGASSTHPPCASLWVSRTPRGRRGRASAGMTVPGSLTAVLLGLGHEGAGRNVLGRNIGMIERIEHRPQHVALELERSQHRLLGVGRLRVALDVIEGELGIALGERRALGEIGKRVGADEIVTPEHALEPLADDLR